jgi:DNA-binding MarR family transcriptional regulator
MTDIVFDMLLLEADRIAATRQKDFDLYMKNAKGEFVKIAEAYESQATEIINSINKRKKLKYYVTFQEGINIQEKLTPSSLRILRFFARVMNYGNQVKGYGIRDIIKCTGVSSRYAQAAIKQLLAEDVIRMEKVKNHRIYMVNPIHLYKGTMKKLFLCVTSYKAMEQQALDGSMEYNPMEDDE